MKKYAKKFLGFAVLCVLVLAFNMTALADTNQTDKTFYKESNLKVASPNITAKAKFYDESDLISPRTPSTLGWYSVTAYPCVIGAPNYFSKYPLTYYNPYGGGQTASFKVSKAVEDCYINNNCNGWWIVAEANVRGVYRVEIDANGKTYTDNTLQNMYSRATFKFELPAHGLGDRAAFVLYGYDSSSRPAYINGMFEW